MKMLEIVPDRAARTWTEWAWAWGELSVSHQSALSGLLNGCTVRVPAEPHRRLPDIFRSLPGWSDENPPVRWEEVSATLIEKVRERVRVAYEAAEMAVPASYKGEARAVLVGALTGFALDEARREAAKRGGDDGE